MNIKEVFWQLKEQSSDDKADGGNVWANAMAGMGKSVSEKGSFPTTSSS